MKNLMMNVKNKMVEFWNEEDGIGTVEMILILVVLIGIVLIFKDNLNDLVESLFKTINSQAKRI
ncbi:Flp1 family type IVb pilin [Pseudobutyrivibrio xylanivorans]|uniref:Putative Flagellin, Flp1-like, domain n=1 Tax=Pseudobutyrivibrio xylanivorans TaxID=185007 RepID=A0A1G5RXW8_PSEXY|nr:Flp1 family type IVb pilin [Pseudobutyrivibrio xylanivorans]SCZ78856.1 Putative Flagellin, Flp1-like, domain [Pseudobutyrivibrio xylanivorans]